MVTRTVFPSPVGELHFSIKKWKQTKNFMEVSVPCRGTTFLNDHRRYQWIIWKTVSVPCRGTTFLNRLRLCYRNRAVISVPCRGTTFLNQRDRDKQKRGRGFPSPVGELHFSMENIMIKKYWKICFRPLSGNYISQSYSEYDLIESPAMFPSPVGELHFSMMHTHNCLHWQRCFRPLSGNYISQYKISFCWHKKSLFPSPVGELHFSIKEEIRTARGNFSFRPLSGNYISQWRSQSPLPYRLASFRPLSGNYISQYFNRQIRLLRFLQFPSPVGELHFSITVKYCCLNPVQFPSPVGELHFSIIYRRI